jgi:hypothetical protein
MPAGQLLFESEVVVEDALARAAGLADGVSSEQPVALYAATLTGDALCLGRYQNERQVLGDAQPWLRRSTGGSLVRAGQGVAYVALALHDRSSLLQCPPGRLLNRNVRGVLTGLRSVGLSINYFGRDFLSHGAEPVIYVAWDLTERGRVLLEFFVAYTHPWFVSESEQAYPPRKEPALRGRAPTTIATVRPELDANQLFRAIADGHAQGFDVIWSEAKAAPASADNLAATHTRVASDGLRWSSPVEEAIGFVSAGVALDSAGNFASVRVAGDFFAHRACAATLEKVLCGSSPDAQQIAKAVDAVFARSGYDVEGIRSLTVIRDAIVLAAEAAKTAEKERSE